MKVPSSFEIPLGSKSVSLFIRGSSLCVATRGGLSGLPPVYIASWNVSDLRRFGLQNGLFCFDACNCDGKTRDIYCNVINQNIVLQECIKTDHSSYGHNNSV